MKNLSIATLALILGLLTFSCEKDNQLSEQNNEENQGEVLDIDESQLNDFKGLLVNHRFCTPLEYLDVEYSYEVLQTIYNSQKPYETTLKSGSDQNFPSIMELGQQANEIITNYPYDADKTAEEKWEMIKKDFPTMTEEEIAENIDLIDEYYAQNLNYETITNLTVNDGGIQLKSASNYDDAYKVACVASGYYASSHWTLIQAAYAINKSFEDAKTYSESAFPGQDEQDTQRDATRHILLNALLALHYPTITAKVPRGQFAETIANLIEECNKSNSDAAMQMDYHNNRIGRVIFDQKCTYKTKRFFWKTWIYGLNLPSTSQLVEESKNRVNSGSYIGEPTYLTPSDVVAQIERTDHSQVVYLKRY